MGEWFLGSGNTALRNHVRDRPVKMALRRRGQEFSQNMLQVQGMHFIALTHQWSCHWIYPRTPECFLMVEPRTGFHLIITANLPQGQNNRFKLTALVERLSFNVRHIFDAGEKKRRLSSRCLINEHPPSSFFAATHTQATLSPTPHLLITP